MTRDEVKELLMTLDVTYKNFRLDPEKVSFTINSWLMFLEEYSKSDIFGALKTYIELSNSSFPPTPSELIGCVHKKSEVNQLNASEAWDMVRTAIGRSIYHAEDEYKKLPEIAQMVVGSPNMLYVWATSENFAEGTVMREFYNSYEAIQKRENELNRMPELRIEASKPIKIEEKKDVPQIGEPMPENVKEKMLELF